MQICTDHQPSADALEMLENDDNLHFSEPLVMASAAGWYVGQVYKDREFGDIGPYDRLSYYVATPEEAIALYEHDHAV